jgi:hypothetical protein
MRAAHHVDHFSAQAGPAWVEAATWRIKAVMPWIKDTLAGIALVAFMIAAFSLASALQNAF